MAKCIFKPWSSDTVKYHQRKDQCSRRSGRQKIYFASLDSFFTKLMLDIIVIETNQKIDETMVKIRSMLAAVSSSRYGYVRVTNPLEVLALNGMSYMRGLLGQAHQNTNAMFHEIFGNPVFSATMSKNRFKFLIARISFDNHTTHPTREQLARFAAFCEIFEEFNENLRKISSF